MSSIPIQNSNVQDLPETLLAQKKQKEELRTRHEQEMENLKRSYAAEKADLEDRFEASAQSERLNHYDHLRNLKGQINREERSLESRGREAIDRKSSTYRNEEIRIDSEGRLRVDQAKKKAAAIEEYERQSQSQASDDAHQNHLKNTNLILQENERALEALRENKSRYLEDQKSRHAADLIAMQEHFEGLREQKLDQHQEEVHAIETRANQTLNQKAISSGEKIGLFETRNQDPFYRLRKFDTTLTDAGDEFILTVKVPEHERKDIKIQANARDVQLTGIRTSTQEAQENGSTFSSRSHQAYSEKFQVNHPIDSKGISRVETTDGFTYTLPKIGVRARDLALNRSREEGLKQDSVTTRDLRFAESLPSPESRAALSGKGTLG